MFVEHKTVRDIVEMAATEIGLFVDLVDVLASNDPDTRTLSASFRSAVSHALGRYPYRTEYHDADFVQKADGTTSRQISSSDDTVLIDARLLINGTKWRFQKARGFNYAEDFRAEEVRLSHLAYDRHREDSVDLNA